MYSSETVKQVNDWMINNISDWMVENGTENTTEGNWIIHIDEIVKKFNVTKIGLLHFVTRLWMLFMSIKPLRMYSMIFFLMAMWRISILISI